MKFVQTFMVPRECILMALVIAGIFLLRHQQVDILNGIPIILSFTLSTLKDDKHGQHDTCFNISMFAFPW